MSLAAALVAPLLLAAPSPAAPPSDAPSAPRLVAAAPAAAPAAPGASSPAAALVETGAAGLAAIRPEALSGHVRFLSSDLLEGRAPGSAGHALAELYVSTAMQAAGLQPAGESGGWLQPVPLRGWKVDPAASRLALHGPGKPLTALVPDSDFVMVSDGEHGEVEVDGPLAFAGFGISAPEYGYDDLKGVDFRGKVAVVLHGAPLSDQPNFFPPAAHAVYSDRREKIRRLAARGATGVLFVHTPEWAESLPWDGFVRSARLEGMGWLDGGRLGGGVQGVPARGVLSAPGFEKLLAAAGVPGGMKAVLEKAEASRLAPQAWKLRARLASRAEMRGLSAANVAGLLPGSDPARGAEVVVFTAHLDHLGVGDPVDGDAIYNGAMDNASGVAILLELARAFAALPTRPARSVLFLAVTGEEKGLVGSEYFAAHPTVPRERIVADLNLDGAPGPFPFEDLVARGAAHSTLGRAVEDAAAAMGLPISPDPVPRANAFIRSDQYSFVRVGIPSLAVAPGRLGGDPEARRRWWRERYHTPKDEWEASWDWNAMARFARLQLLTGLAVAQAPERPRWNRGDLFEPQPRPHRRPRRPVATGAGAARRRAAATSASFSARVSRFRAASQRSAAPRSRTGRASTSTTGSLERV